MGVRSVILVAVLMLGVACGTDPGASDEATTSDDVDARVETMVDELNRFWFDELDAVGLDYVTVPTSRVGDGDDGLTCDGVEIVEDDDLADNAWVDAGCTEGITVAYDPDELLRTPLGVELTLAHEWGHVVQAQFPELDAALDGWPIDGELQADCLMGAWAATGLDGDDLDQAVREVRATGDDAEVPPDDPEAHGSPSERVAAFELGLESGAIGCVDDLDAVLPG